MSIPNWENSDGRVVGCLPRASKRGQYCPLFPKGWVIPKREWSDILAQPNHMKLRPSVPVILDQNGVGCHDDKTEVLTESGWQSWSDYDRKSALGTINPLTHMLEFQLPTELHSYDYDGPMHIVDHRSMSFSVTPNHRMYLRKWNQRRRELDNCYDVCNIEDMGWYSGLLSCSSGFVGTEIVNVRVGERPYVGDDFLALVSLVASDGWVGGSESTWNRVSFCCFRSDRIEMVRALANHLGFCEQSNRTGVWVQRNPQLANWFRANLFTGDVLRSPYKRIPAIVKCAGMRQIKLFLEFYGDQHIHNGRRQFYTSSRQMADDLQELLLRIGKRSGICELKLRDTVMKDGREIKASNCHTPYAVTEWTKDHLSIERKKVEIDHYKGMVYCATVPNSLLVTRRDKKVLISGNSCATEATAQPIMTLRSFNGQEFVKLNPWFIYYTTSGGRDGGSNIDTNLKFARERGCAPESVWPRSKGWRKKPNEEAVEAAKDYKILEFYDIRGTEELGSALLLGLPVAYGRSGHAITAVDLVTPTTMRYANSWGNWGDKGFAVESIKRVNFGYGCWAIRVVTGNWKKPSSIATASAQIPMPPMVFEQYPVIASV